MGDLGKVRTRILALDGGGAKGIYTLGILHEVEAIADCPLSDVFGLIYGTSTGAIIASLLALGFRTEKVLAMYREQVPQIMRCRTKGGKTQKLAELADEFFNRLKFDAFKTRVGIVCTNWEHRSPHIFKSHPEMAFGLRASFDPGFGCTIAQAVRASCSAYPFFDRQRVLTSNQGSVELVDGGFSANNPTLFAITDALMGLKVSREDLRVISLGCGCFPERTWTLRNLIKRIPLPSVRLLDTILNVNVATMEKLGALVFPDVRLVRINDAFSEPTLATDFLEADELKLNSLYQKGRESAGLHEKEIREMLR